jgi:hypothetical protein
MKTIAELASECGVHRTTLNKAVARLGIPHSKIPVPYRKSGDIILVDDESEQFKQWLTSVKLGRPRKSSLPAASE